MLGHTDASGLRHPSGRHIPRSDFAMFLVLFMTSLDQCGCAYLTQSGWAHSCEVPSGGPKTE